MNTHGQIFAKFHEIMSCQLQKKLEKMVFSFVIADYITIEV